MLPSLSPSHPPIHRPHMEAVSLLGAQAVSISEATESESALDQTIAVMGAKEGQRNIGTTPSFFLWLLSFFLEPLQLEEDHHDFSPPPMIV